MGVRRKIGEGSMVVEGQCRKRKREAEGEGERERERGRGMYSYDYVCACVHICKHGLTMHWQTRREVASPKGLVVPVVRDCQSKSINQASAGSSCGQWRVASVAPTHFMIRLYLAKLEATRI